MDLVGEIELDAGPDAASLAREAVATLDLGEVEERLPEVQLATSEVVTNAVRHGRLREGVDAVRITVATDEDAAKITVEQPTRADGVRVVDPRFEDEIPGGFGLRL